MHKKRLKPIWTKSARFKIFNQINVCWKIFSWWEINLHQYIDSWNYHKMRVSNTQIYIVISYTITNDSSVNYHPNNHNLQVKNYNLRVPLSSGTSIKFLVILMKKPISYKFQVFVSWRYLSVTWSSTNSMMEWKS